MDIELEDNKQFISNIPRITGVYRARGGSVGRERGVISYIWHSTDLFQLCHVYDWPLFFNKNYMRDPIFLDSYVKGPTFLTPWYMHIFFAQRFFELACSLGMQ